MDATDRLVVVISPVTMAYSEGEGLYAARFAELGLTSYGDTPEKAVTKLKGLFNAFIHSCREYDILEGTLNRLKVRWHWADEYPDDAPEYEDTNEPPKDTGQRVREAMASDIWVSQGNVANADLAAAA